MKLNNITKVEFDTNYSKNDRVMVESAVDFLGTLKSQLNYGKLDPDDNVTKNKIALFVGLLTKVRQFKDGSIGKDDMINLIKGISNTGDKTNAELDLMHDLSLDPKAINTRNNIIAALQGPSSEDSPEVVTKKKETKQKFLVALNNMQTSFHSKIQPSVAAQPANKFKMKSA